MKKDDILKRIKEIMLKYIGNGNPINAGEIAKQVGLKEEDTHVEPRKYIYEMMKKYKIPVAGGSRGYFIIENGQDLQNYFDSIDGRIEEMQNRKRTVQAVFNSFYKK